MASQKREQAPALQGRLSPARQDDKSRVTSHEPRLPPAAGKQRRPLHERCTVGSGENWRAFERCVKLCIADAKSATAETWNFGLCATRSREPRQARKGATVPGKPSVPRRSRSSSL